ncbi:MAG: hypothetical protein FJ403_02675 [Verrucomicrobia bacterium]|nr:hypothetical protein [Verrucomicrobiota bacterium]
MPAPSNGVELYKIVNGKFITNSAAGGIWKNPDEKLEPGEGAIVFNPGSRTFTANFRGELLQGDLVNRIPAGLSIKGSLVPQSGPITSGLQLQLSPFDNLYQWKTNRYEVYTYLPNGTWSPSEPLIRLGESFIIRANQSATWSR